jgi:ABC-type transport system involved in cytochrome c biogenesis permease subunit
MNSSFLLSIITFVYGLAGFLYIFAWVFKKPSAGRLATWVALFGLIGNTAGILLRWVESYRMGIGHAPFSNLFESLVFFAWTITLIYLVIERRANNRIIGVFTMPIAFLAMAYASLKPGISNEIQPLLPALKSNWLIAHVITCFIGYAAFALAFGISAMYLIKQGRDEEEVTWMNFAKPLTLFVFVLLFSRVLLVGNWTMSVIVAVPICALFYICVLLAHRLPADLKNRLLAMFPEPPILDELGYQMTLFGFGPVLGLGPQGNLVVDHMVRLRHFATRKVYARLARQAHCLFVPYRICCGYFYLFWGQLVARPAQLRGHGPMIFS